jgi:hypothetical protein
VKNILWRVGVKGTMAPRGTRKRPAGHYKNLQVPNRSRSGVNANKDKTPEKKSGGNDKPLRDLGLSNGKSATFDPKQTSDKTDADTKDIGDAANTQAHTTDADSDAVGAVADRTIAAGQKNGGELPPKDLAESFDAGFDSGRQANIDSVKSKDPEARAKEKQSAMETLESIDGNGFKKTLGGLLGGLRRIKLAYRLLLVALGALAYFGYAIAEYAECLRKWRATYKSIIEDERDLEEELEKAKGALSACLGDVALAEDACEGITPAPVSATTTLANTSAAVPLECDALLARWCLLQDAEREFLKCQNAMPLSGILDGALSFIKNVAQDVVDTVADIASVVVKKAVDVVGDAAGGAVKSVTTALLPIFLVAVVACLIAGGVVLFVRSRRARPARGPGDG